MPGQGITTLTGQPPLNRRGGAGTAANLADTDGSNDLAAIHLVEITDRVPEHHPRIRVTMQPRVPRARPGPGLHLGANVLTPIPQ